MCLLLFDFSGLLLNLISTLSLLGEKKLKLYHNNFLNISRDDSKFKTY